MSSRDFVIRNLGLDILKPDSSRISVGMTSLSPSIRPADRAVPRPAGRVRRAKPAGPVKPASKAAPGRKWLLPAAVGGIGFCIVSAGLAAWLLLDSEQPVAKQIAAIKIGPMAAELPDLRDGVPALLPARKKPAAPAAPSSASIPPARTETHEDANRRAMASTIATANLRPALTAPQQAAASLPAPAAAPVASPPVPAPTLPEAQPRASVQIGPDSPAPARQIDTRKPVESAALDARRPVETSSAPAPAVPVAPPPLVPPPAAASETPREPMAARPAPEAARVAREAPPASVQSASLPTNVPLPPRRPDFSAPAPANERAAAPAPASGPAPLAERPTAPKARQASASPRPAAPQAAAPAEPKPAAQQDEDRSVLGIPVPKFVPTGRDIRDAASTLTDAVTGRF